MQSKLFYVYVLLCAPHSLVVCVVCSPVIQQSPKHLLRRVEEKEANLSCRHGDSSYQYLYWYQQKSNGGSLELIGMLNYGTLIGMLRVGEPSPEDKFKTRFKITGHATQDAFLLISNISAEDSAVYFCAASEHSCTVHYKL
uniref:Ig-like domain-containing protein n=1 Tax=Cyprinus carpio TaxID=7962 RepID=A0A8C2IQG9_CYPCA